MSPRFRLADGLPTRGPLATAFPEAWGRFGREGVVVEFTPENSERWFGNFRRGIRGLTEVRAHWNGRDALVLANGDLWIVNPETRHATMVVMGVSRLWEVHDPEGMVLSVQDIRFVRVGPSGIVWRSSRISWDGFDQIEVRDDELSGVAWSPTGGGWMPFRLDLATGAAVGGSYPGFTIESKPAPKKPARRPRVPSESVSSMSWWARTYRAARALWRK